MCQHNELCKQTYNEHKLQVHNKAEVGYWNASRKVLFTADLVLSGYVLFQIWLPSMDLLKLNGSH